MMFNKKSKQQEAPIVVVSAPIGYAVYNGANELIETVDTNTAALRLIDWLVINESAMGPYRFTPIHEKAAIA